MRFYGEVGYADETVESPPDSGVWVDNIIEKVYFGDVLRNTRRMSEGQSLNNDLSVNNSISIVADAYASENFMKMRYIRWNGVLWSVDVVEVQRPRLILQLGGVYNGPVGTAPGP